MSRSRPLYTFWILLTIASGLLLRSRHVFLPPAIEKYGGDLLWALMVFLGFGWLFRRSATLRIGAMALAFAWAIEFLQLYRAGWLDAIRQTRPGHLVLGSTFNSPDLLAYAAGIALGIAFESLAARRRPSSP